MTVCWTRHRRSRSRSALTKIPRSRSAVDGVVASVQIWNAVIDNTADEHQSSSYLLVAYLAKVCWTASSHKQHLYNTLQQIVDGYWSEMH